MDDVVDRESVTEVLFRENLTTRYGLAEMAKRIADRLERESERPPKPAEDEESQH